MSQRTEINFFFNLKKPVDSILYALIYSLHYFSIFRTLNCSRPTIYYRLRVISLPGCIGV